MVKTSAVAAAAIAIMSGVTAVQDGSSNLLAKQDVRSLQQVVVPPTNLHRLAERGLTQQDDSGRETADIGGGVRTPPSDQEIADFKTLLAQELADLNEDLYLGEGQAADQYRESVYPRFLAWYYWHCW